MVLQASPAIGSSATQLKNTMRFSARSADQMRARTHAVGRRSLLAAGA
jgi:hypothetical protein